MMDVLFQVLVALVMAVSIMFSPLNRLFLAGCVLGLFRHAIPLGPSDPLFIISLGIWAASCVLMTLGLVRHFREPRP